MACARGVAGVIAETFETAVRWGALPALYEGVQAAVQEAIAACSGQGFVTCRTTHAYTGMYGLPAWHGRRLPWPVVHGSLTGVGPRTLVCRTRAADGCAPYFTVVAVPKGSSAMDMLEVRGTHGKQWHAAYTARIRVTTQRGSGLPHQQHAATHQPERCEPRAIGHLTHWCSC